MKDSGKVPDSRYSICVSTYMYVSVVGRLRDTYSTPEQRVQTNEPMVMLT